jgi:hypothetical protein
LRGTRGDEAIQIEGEWDIGGFDFVVLGEIEKFVESFVLPRAEGIQIKESGSQPVG